MTDDSRKIELAGAAGETDTALRVSDISPKKSRRAVTYADQCYWCEEPFAEPKRKRYIIMDCGSPSRGWENWELRSICFDCFKSADPEEWKDCGLKAEEWKTCQCQGCGEPISIPVPPPNHRWNGSFKWFNWEVCSMRCYQRLYRKRRSERGGSVIEWKRGPKDGKRCEACKQPVPRTRRGDARFCSNRCRQWTYRRRRVAGRDGGCREIE